MSMFTKGRKQNIVMLLAVATLIFLLFKMNSTKSGYAITERQYSAFGAAPAAGPTAAPAATSNGCGMDKGTGLASSLPVRSPRLRTSVSLPQRTSSRVKTSLSPVPRLVSPRLSVALSAMPTSRFARIPPTPRTPSCGTTPPLSPTPCSVDCALKD
jgi:hypothetical protein